MVQTEDFDFVGAGDKKGSLNKRDFDLTNMTSTLSDQSKDFAEQAQSKFATNKNRFSEYFSLIK